MNRETVSKVILIFTAHMKEIKTLEIFVRAKAGGDLVMLIKKKEISKAITVFSLL